MIPIEDVPVRARNAWTRLRDELVAIIGSDLAAVWAFGGTTTAPHSGPIGDLDTLVVLRRPLDVATTRTIEEAQATIADEAGVEWDAWYVFDEDVRGSGTIRHAWRNRRNETWALDRAHLLAGRCVILHGPSPLGIVRVPTRAELDAALGGEMEHLENHVAAGDTDPYEATYAILNGCRMLQAVETEDAATSKREAGPWGLAHLPDRWHPAIRSAIRAYDGHAMASDDELLAQEMAPFVAMLRERLALAMRDR